MYVLCMAILIADTCMYVYHIMLLCWNMYVYVTDSEEGSWYPREKLKQAEKKLQGYNSAHIMR